jgi:hypothetical protein
MRQKESKEYKEFEEFEEFKEFKEFEEFEEFEEFKETRGRACEQPSGIAWYQKDSKSAIAAKILLTLLLVLLVLLHPYELRRWIVRLGVGVAEGVGRAGVVSASGAGAFCFNSLKIFR